MSNDRPMFDPFHAWGKDLSAEMDGIAAGVCEALEGPPPDREPELPEPEPGPTDGGGGARPAEQSMPSSFEDRLLADLGRAVGRPHLRR